MKLKLKRVLAVLVILAMTAGLMPSYAAENITVTLSVETRTVNGQDLVEPTEITIAKGTNLEKILLDVCKKQNIEVDNSQGYVAAIAGIKNDPAIYHAWSGWMYWANGAPGMVGAAEYIPADGDVLRWRFSVSGDMYGNDVTFADTYRALKEQVAAVDAFSDEDYAKYSDEELDTLLMLYGDATAKVTEIEEYPSEQGKAAGLPGFILAKNVSQWDGEGRAVWTLAKKLAFAIEKKQYIPAESISMDQSRITLVQGQSIQLNAIISPANATDSAIFWDAMNLQGEASAEVSVSQDGTVTANAPTSFATVRARHGEVLSPATCVIKVVAPPEDSALSSLALTGAVMRPSFSKSQLQYRAQVAEDTESIRVKAEAPGAAITIGGQTGTDITIPIQSGENKIEVISKVADKPEMTYTIRVIRGDLKKQFAEIADNITNSYAYTADAWRILDTVFHVGRTGAKINKSQYLKNVQAALNGEAVSLGTLATHVLVLTAMGEDPTAFASGDTVYNLVEMLAGHSGYQSGETLDIYSACTALYAMIPYVPQDKNAWSAPKIADALLAEQLEDGSWGFDGKNGDIDVTAMIAAALAPLKSDGKVKSAVDKAITYLSNAQQSNGGYTSFGSNNANSAEMVLIALCANGIDAAEDSRFVKNGYHLLDALASFITEDRMGVGFTDNTYNSYATEQGLRAFATYLRFLEKNRPSKGVSPYIYTDATGKVADGADADANLTALTVSGTNLEPGFDPAITAYSATLDADHAEITAAAAQGAAVSPESASLSVGVNDIPVTVTAKNGSKKVYTLSITRPSSGGDGGGSTTQEKVSIAIKGYQGESILAAQSTEFITGDTPYTVLKRIADQNDIEIETTGSGSSIYVSSIAGCAELDYGAKSGWMYSVNGTYYQKSAGSFKLKAGDKLIWIYTTDLGNDIGGGSASGGIYQKPGEQEDEEIAETPSISQTKKVLQAKSDWSVWEAFGLAIAGEKLPKNELRQEIIATGGEFRKITDTAGYALLLSALGYDAANIDGINLIEILANSERMMNQGTNGPIFALIAMDSLAYSDIPNAKWSRDALISAILSAQNTDGGIALVKGEESNVDLTAMAITALSGYGERKEVSDAVSKMLAYLSGEQKTSGGFALYDVENCESAAQVAIALRAQGISLTDSRFVKNGKSVLDAMNTYRLSDGTYCHEAGGKSDAIATEQAFLALLAAEKNTSIYRLSARTFRDEAEISDWAHDAVLLANEKGIILGDQGSFAPKRALSRAELAQILVRALDLKAGEDTAYRDVSKSDWYYSAVSAICKSGLMRGAGDSFRPNDRITREELAVVIARAANLTGQAEIADLASVSDWARGAVQAVYQHGIMQGNGNTFRPKDAVTREMAATVCIRALDLIK